MKDRGSTITEISKQLECSRMVVYNALRHKDLYGSAKNVPRAKRPRKTTTKEDNIIYRASVADPFSSSKAIKSSVLNDSNIFVSDRTIRRRLQEKNLRGCIAKKKPLVTNKNLKVRKSFAKEHLNKPISFWKNVLWSDEGSDQMAKELVITHITGLERCGLIVKDQTFGLSVASTSIGKLMARYYISFETIKVFRQLQGNESFLDVFNTIIRSKEFSEFTLRVNDKKILNAINNHPIRFPIKGKVKTNENKISCLVQAVFDNITIPDPSMLQDALRMVRIGEKLSKCLAEYIRLSEGFLCGKIYKALSSALIIAKCYKARLWYNTEFVSKQLKNIGPVYSTHLVNAGKTTIKSLLETDARKIEMILGKAPPFGDQILETLSEFPQYSINLVRNTQHFFKVSIRQTNERFCYEGQNSFLIVGDANNNLLFYHTKVDQTICEEKTFQRTFSLKDESTKFVEAKLIHECIVGVDEDEKIVLNPDEELPDPKPKKAKMQTKIKFKSNRKASSIDSAKQDLHEFLLDGDDYFKEIDVKEVAATTSISETSGDDKSAEQPPVKFIKRKLQSFEYVPLSKISNNNITASDLIDDDSHHSSQHKETNHNPYVAQNYLEETDQDIPLGNASRNSNDFLLEDIPSNEIIEDFLEHNFQLEEEFLKSQISKQEWNKETQVDNLNMDQEEPLDLTVKSDLQNTTSQLNLTYCVRPLKIDTMPEKPSTSLNKRSNNLSLNSVNCAAESDGEKLFANLIDSNASGSNDPKMNKNKETTSSNKLFRQVPQSCSLKQDFFKRDIFELASTRIENRTNTLEFERRPNLSKLGQFSLRFTPVLRRTTKIADYWKTGSKSCSLINKKSHIDSTSKLFNSHQNKGKTILSENIIHQKKPSSLANNCSSIFNGIKFSQNSTQKGNEDIILSQLCQNYIPTKRTNNQTQDLLKKLEKELYLESQLEANKEDNHVTQFFKETSSCEKLPPPNSCDIKTHAEKIFQFRASFQQPTFQKVLPVKTDKVQQRQMPIGHLLKYPRNPENDRIDEILHNVVQEPFRNLTSAIHNPYRMKLPRKHKTFDLHCQSRQNFEYFENLKRKTELEKLNTFIAPNCRNEAYMSQMSKILFADLKESSFPPVSNYIKTESLPKPDFELIEREKKRRLFQKVRPVAASAGGFRTVFNTNHDMAKTKDDELEETFAKASNMNTSRVSAFNLDYTSEKLEKSLFDADAVFDSFPANTSLSNFQNYYTNENADSNDMGFHFDMNAYQPATTFMATSSEFVSPSKFRSKPSIDFENLCTDPCIKNEPLSPSFEALSLLDDNDGEDALLSQVKLEPTQNFLESFIDLTAPFSDKSSLLGDMEIERSVKDDFFDNGEIL